MVDPTVYLEKLSFFSRMLRMEGLPVTPKETEDACKVMIEIGLENRNRFTIALRTVYAKSREEQLIFDRVFDGFFVSEEVMKQQAQQKMQQEMEMQQRLENARNDLQLNGSPLSLTEEQKNAYAALPASEQERLRNFMEKYKDSAVRNPNLYGNFIHSVFARAILEQQMLMEDAGLGVDAADPEI